MTILTPPQLQKLSEDDVLEAMMELEVLQEVMSEDNIIYLCNRRILAIKGIDDKYILTMANDFNY